MPKRPLGHQFLPAIADYYHTGRCVYAVGTENAAADGVTWRACGQPAEAHEPETKPERPGIWRIIGNYFGWNG